MPSLNNRLIQLQQSIKARLARRFPTQQPEPIDKTIHALETLEDRMLLSATLIVDAGVDLNADEGQEAVFSGTFEDTGGGTPGTFDTVQLTTTSADERQHDIDGARSVWESDGEIFFFDGTTDEFGVPNVINVTGNTPSFESDPHISGDHIVWAGGGIKAYNINTGVTTTLTTGAVANPEIDGDIAVWSELNGSFFTIMMADLSAATPTAVSVPSTITGSQRDPKISGDNIIWLAPGVGSFNDVYVHNLTTGITTNASSTAFAETAHQIDGGVIVWSGTDPSVASPTADVYVFDGRGFDGTGTAPAVANLGSAALFDVVPKVSGANIVWDGNADVFHHNLDTGITTNLTNAPASFLTEPDISGSNITWSTGNEVFLFNLDTEITTNISNSSLVDTQALVSGNNVVWLGQNSIFTPKEVFFAIGSSDATFTVDWDFGDGTVITDTTLDQTHTYADNGNYTVTLTVNASDGRVSTDTLAATIDNVAPEVAPIDGPAEFLRGNTATFSSSFTDPGTADTHSTEWTVTDSLGAVVATGTGTTLDFSTDDAGTFDITFTVTDDDGGVGTSTVSTTTKIIIVGADPLDPAQTTIQVAGSDGRDIIYVSRDHHHANALKVLVYEKDTHTLTVQDNIVGADRIIADGRGGNDKIKILHSAGNITADLYGGDGNDWLRGGNGSDFISGGDGNDLISGGNGRDFLVGGLGGDFIVGHNDDDILVGGTYTQHRDLNATRAIQAEWNRTDVAYASRVDNLKNGTGLNGGFVLNSTNVFDDNASDILLGLRGLDWFHANDAQDFTDQRRNEMFEDTELEFVDSEDEYVVEE